MKRILMIFAVAAVTLSFVACGGKSTKSEGTETTSTEETTTSNSSDKDVLAQYEELVNKAIALYPKVKEGDLSASQEYLKISEDMTELSLKMAEEMPEMTMEQAQKFAELGQKLAAAMQ